MSKFNRSVLEKEEQYIRINAELEEKTAALVKEADSLLKKSSNKVSPSLLLETDVSLNEDDLNNISTDLTEIEPDNIIKPVDVNTDFKKKVEEISENYNKNKSKQSNIKPINTTDVEEEDSCLEVQNRYLKAKLRVLQEDNEKLAKDFSKKQEDFTVLQNRIKDLEDERNRLQRVNNTQSSQIDKSKKLMDDAKSKTDLLESQIAALKKDLDQSKRATDQQSTNNKTNEVRMNRAIDEANKLKNQLAQIKSTQKDSVEQDKKKIDQLLNETRRLERQKAELVQAFRKQMQLIDVLKKQKMQIEVAKMLQFTEEEFVKALDWEK